MTMKKYSKPETNVMEIETQEALLSFSNIHEEESDGTSPMSLEPVSYTHLTLPTILRV